MFLVKFYWCMIKLNVRVLYATSSQFWLVILSVSLDMVVSLLTIDTVFLHTSNLGGWTRGETLFLYGFWYMSFAFYHTFMNGVQDIPQHISYGTLDNILTRPVPALIYVTGMKVSPYGVTSIIGGLVIMVYGSEISGIHWTIEKFIFLAIFLASTNFINYGIQLVLASLSFIFGPANNIFMIFWNLVNLASFPLTIFSSLTQGILTLTTIAFLSYWPSSYLLEKPSGIFGLFTPFVAVICTSIGLCAWESGLRRYQSSGT